MEYKHWGCTLMVCEYKSHGKGWHCQSTALTGKTANRVPGLGMVRFECLLLHSFFSFICFSENSLTCPEYCYACCLIATYDETRPQRPQWICYLSGLKLSYCSSQDWAGPSNTGGNSSRTPFKTFLVTLNKPSWLTTTSLSSKNKEKQIKIIRKKISYS